MKGGDEPSCWFPFCKHSWTLSKPETETGLSTKVMPAYNFLAKPTIGAKDFLDFDLNKDKQIDAQEVRAQFKGELDAKELHQFLGFVCCNELFAKKQMMLE